MKLSVVLKIYSVTIKPRMILKRSYSHVSEIVGEVNLLQSSFMTTTFAGKYWKTVNY